MDSHINKDHGNKASKDFICLKCNLYFKAQHELRLHNEKKHASSNAVECQKCGEVFKSKNDYKNHDVYLCEQMFTRVPKKICRYFANGGCNKGNICKFSHQEQTNDNPRIPECRNGAQCRYLAGGACIFSHWGAGGQNRNQRNSNIFNKPNYNNNFRKPKCRNGAQCRQLANGVCAFYHGGARVHNWNQNFNHKYSKSKSQCYYMEDCTRVPNCPFLHYEQDFPKLPKTGKPPINQKGVGGVF